jgi:hypothetical protein
VANLVADCDEQEASRAERIALLQSRDSSTESGDESPTAALDEKQE